MRSLKNQSKTLIALLTLIIISVGGVLIGNSVYAQKKTKLDAPIVSCAGSTGGSIDLQVCAGASGAPAGFSIQWMTLADYNQYGWPADSSCPPDADGNPTCGGSFCKASFSGNASGSRYNLAAGECVTVRIGDLLFDNGTSTDCPVALACGTEYVFRAFAHANSKLNRSDFTANINCVTEPCAPSDCTLTQGYWKTHGPEGCATGNNTNQWPVSSLSLGNVSYTDLELCSILNKPAAGNGLLTLAHQLIAAKLNVANGVTCDSAAAAIAAADALIGNKVVPPVGTDTLSNASVSALVTALNNFNNGSGGDGCAGHCASE